MLLLGAPRGNSEDKPLHGGDEGAQTVDRPNHFGEHIGEKPPHQRRLHVEARELRGSRPQWSPVPFGEVLPR